MKLKWVFLVVLILLTAGVLSQGTSCRHTPTHKSKEQLINEVKELESMWSFDTTLYISNHQYHIQIIDYDHNSDTLLLLVKKDTKLLFDTCILKGLINYELTDFDHDGMFDIKLDEPGGFFDLLLYDNINHTFVWVEDLGYISDPVQLKSDSTYYYSYTKGGCADYNWYSYLFTFKNLKVVKLAYLYGHGCDDGKPLEITVYKIQDNDEMSMKVADKYPIAVINEYENWKWGFIDEYWNSYYLNFE